MAFEMTFVTARVGPSLSGCMMQRLSCGLLHAMSVLVVPDVCVLSQFLCHACWSVSAAGVRPGCTPGQG
jgi:hypothetical protein